MLCGVKCAMVRLGVQSEFLAMCSVQYTVQCTVHYTVHSIEHCTVHYKVVVQYIAL